MGVYTVEQLTERVDIVRGLLADTQYRIDRLRQPQATLSTIAGLRDRAKGMIEQADRMQSALLADAAIALQLLDDRERFGAELALCRLLVASGDSVSTLVYRNQLTRVLRKEATE